MTRLEEAGVVRARWVGLARTKYQGAPGEAVGVGPCTATTGLGLAGLPLAISCSEFGGHLPAYLN